MREIKFRGYSRKLKSWLRGSLIYVNKKYYVLPNSNCKNVIKIVKDDGNLIVIAKESNRLVDPKSVGQYTGLKDKNGEEIYEGDIVLVTYKNGECEKFRIGFINGAFVAIDIKNNVSHFNFDDYRIEEMIESIEVVGNIYENPNLLEEY